MEETKQGIIQRVQSKIYSKLPNMLKSAVDEGLKYSRIPTKDLERLRRLVVEVGVRTPKDILQIGAPEPKNNLEKYIYLMAKKKNTPAELASFISKVAYSNTQEEMALALEIAPEELHTLIPDRTTQEVVDAALKLFTAKTLMNILNNILYYGFFAQLGFVKDILGQFMDVGDLAGRIIQKVIFSIKNMILYTIMTFIPMVFRVINKKFVSPLASMLTGMVTSTLMLGKAARKQMDDVIDDISEAVGDKVPNLVKVNKTGSEVAPQKEEATQSIIESFTQSVMATAKDISNYFSKRSLESMRQMAAEIGVSTYHTLSLAEDVSASTPLEKRILAQFKEMRSPQKQLLFVSEIYQAQDVESLIKVLGIGSASEISTYFPTRGETLLKRLGYFSVAFLFGLGLMAFTASFGGVSVLLAQLMAHIQPYIGVISGFIGVGVLVFIKTMAMKAILSGVIGTTIKFFLLEGPKKVRYVVAYLIDWVKNFVKSAWTNLIGRFKKNKTASSMTTGAMFFDVLREMELR